MASDIFNRKLLLRLISALALLPVVLLPLWYGGFAFKALLAVACLLMLVEWNQITCKGQSLSVLARWRWRVLGFLYIGIPLIAFSWLRQSPDGLWWVGWTFLMVWAMDVGGFFAGKAIGGPKLAPSISPGKTWAGLIGGVALAVAASWVMLWVLSLYPALGAGINPPWYAAGIVALVAQIGDLFESAVKRRFHVKDASGLIPGHGGLLDRADGLMFAGPLVYAAVHFQFLVF